uniref:RNA polymerase sigma factor n=1 Tax=Rhizophora mucronata TaxID=61149 RepID=A0A2P2L9Y4_RHIMU
MEAGRTLLSSPPSFPSRTHLRNSLSSSVSMLHEQAATAFTSVPITSIVPHFPTSVLLQEQRDDFRSILNIFKEDRASQETLDRRQMDAEVSVHQESSDDLNGCHSLNWPCFSNLLSSVQMVQGLSLSLMMQSVATDTDKSIDVEPTDVVNVAKNAFLASREAALLAMNSTSHDNLASTSLGSTSSNFPLEEVITVRSTRRIERQSKTRRLPKQKNTFHEPCNLRRTDVQRKTSEVFDPTDPLQLFFGGCKTNQLLTVKEEYELISQVQELLRLEAMKNRLQSQFGHEPTLAEWAKAVGVSCPVLQSHLQSGNSSRGKLIYANLRMVVHIAKQYQGRGLSLQDLLQEGSMGLMKSVGKFKPQAGCRFATYAYWWVRQGVRKALFRHSRTIRLPENVYTLLGRVLEAKRSCAQEGDCNPTKENLARRVGITVNKLEKLLYMTRLPLSMQQTVWMDQDITFQEITADTEIEIPDISVGKQLMRKHVRGLLNILNPKESRIIRLRYGIDDGKQRSLSEVGSKFGLSRERVRQLENRALYRLKKCIDNHGLEAYADLLV